MSLPTLPSPPSTRPRGRAASRLACASIAAAALVLAAACGSGADPVQPPAPTTITMTLGGDIWEGTAIPIAATVLDQRGVALPGAPVTWSTDDTTIAVVERGTLRGRRPGATALRARSGEAAVVTGIQVRADELRWLSVLGEGDTVILGRTVTLRALAIGTRGGILEGRPVTWEGDAPEVLDLRPDGVARGVALGSARVRATVEGRTAEATFRVVPVPAASVVMTLGEESLPLGGRTTVTAMALAEDGTPIPERPAMVRVADSRIAHVVGAELLAVGSGTVEVEASPGGRRAAATLRVTRPAAEPWMPELHFTPTATENDRAVVREAAARWAELIVGPAPVPPSPIHLPAGACGHAQVEPIDGEIVHRLRLYVQFDSLDGRGGAIAAAGPCVVAREFPEWWVPGTPAGMQRPLIGVVRVDTTDLRQGNYSRAFWRDVLVHEIGHVLGIGTLWHSDHFVAGRGGADPLFVGPLGARAYHHLGGRRSGIPIETGGGSGTVGSHWSEGVFGNEVMTGWVSAGANPISTFTLGALADFGWVVDYGRADEFAAPGARAGVQLEGSARPIVDRVLMPQYEVSGGRTTRTGARSSSPN